MGRLSERFTIRSQRKDKLTDVELLKRDRKPAKTKMAKPTTPVDLGEPTGDSWLWPTQSRRITGGVEPGHIAIDVGAVKPNVRGDPIWSPTGGTITNVAYQKKGYGTHVRLLTAEGLEIIMAHLAAVAPGITIGAEVQPGQVLGLMGSTGYSTGAHLHYEVRVPGPDSFISGAHSTTSAVDPWAFFDPNKTGRPTSMPALSDFTFTPESSLVPPEALELLIAG